jgi:hypothetical protein
VVIFTRNIFDLIPTTFIEFPMANQFLFEISNGDRAKETENYNTELKKYRNIIYPLFTLSEFFGINLHCTSN